MRLLIITGNTHSASFRQRVGIHVDMLRRYGIDCHIAELPSGWLARILLFRSAGDFDCVFLHRKSLSFHDAFHLRRYARRVIYDFDDAIMYDAESPNRRSPRRLKRFRRTIKLADLVAAGNSYLGEHASRFAKRVEILPTGLDAQSYNVQTRRQTDGPIRLVWVGSTSTLMYLIGIRPALDAIGERFRNVVLRMICDSFSDMGRMPVEKRVWSLQTEVMDLVTSDIGLAPLPDDPFTRGKCGFKIIQYAAAGLPVVASPVGVNAEYVNDGVIGFHTTGISEWVDKVGRLIEDRQLRERMGQAARVSVQKFDKGAIGKQLLNIIKTAVQDNSKSELE